MLAVLGERRYTVLFATLLATIAAGPLLSNTRLVGPVLEVFLGLSLIAAVMPMRKARDRMLLLAIVLAAVVIRHAPLGGRRESISLVLWSVVALFAAYRSMRHSLSDLRVNAEHVFAALNAYLLVGIFGGALCVALEAASPGSLLVQGKPLEGDLPMGGDLFQLRHAGHAGLRRHRPCDSHRTGIRSVRSDRWAVLPGGACGPVGGAAHRGGDHRCPPVNTGAAMGPLTACGGFQRLFRWIFQIRTGPKGGVS